VWLSPAWRLFLWSLLMASFFSFFTRRRWRLLTAAVLTVVLQFILLLLPGVAEARPLLSAAAVALPSVVVLLPSSKDTAFEGHSLHRDNVLGTSMDLYVSTPSESDAQACEAVILGEVDRLERILSTRDPASEISRVNRGEQRPESPELREVLALCDQWCERTDGAFDSRLGALVQLWRQAEQNGMLPDDITLRNLVAKRDQQPINVDALGKAFILDRAARLARTETGVRGLLLDIGGDIIALGDCNGAIGSGWEVGVAHPQHPEDNAPPMTRLHLRDQAVATSAAYERPMTIQGVRHSHILDPRTGKPAHGVASATVVAADGATANALATALCILFPKDGIALIERTPGTACLVVDGDGTEHRSTGLVERAMAVDTCADKWPDNHQMTIAIKLNSFGGGRRVRRPYVAVWIEDADGKPVRTLSVWGRDRKYLRDLSDWWKAAAKEVELAKVITRATRAPGSYTLAWDGTDDKGKAMPPGTYIVQVEVNREHGKHVRQTGKIECSNDKATLTLKATEETGETQVQYGPREKK
jgi:thiamine biosynthesis lipoprotein ApbE